MIVCVRPQSIRQCEAPVCWKSVRMSSPPVESFSQSPMVECAVRAMVEPLEVEYHNGASAAYMLVSSSRPRCSVRRFGDEA